MGNTKWGNTVHEIRIGRHKTRTKPRVTNRTIKNGKYKLEDTIRNIHSENTHLEIQIGKTGRKVPKGKYNSENRGRKIQMVKLQIKQKKNDPGNTNRVNSNREIQFGNYISENYNSGNTNGGIQFRPYKSENIYRESINQQNKNLIIHIEKYILRNRNNADRNI